MNNLNIKIYPAELSGTLPAIPSKSAAHRALICEFLAGESGIVECDGSSADIDATVECLQELYEQDFPILRVRESGSTFRFLLPIVAALGKKAYFLLEGRLPERPLSPLYEELVKHGCKMSPQGSQKFGVSGQLKPGTYKLNAGVSSQFISGLLFALPLLDGNSKIQLTGKVESMPYIDMTVEMLERFGIELEFKSNIFHIKGNQTYRTFENIDVEGDWSNAAFWFAAQEIGKSQIKVTGLDNKSKQGDKAIVELLDKVDIDASDVPDLVPILTVVAAARNGTTVIRNAGRLRIKESDRLAAITEVLNKLGADVTEKDDGLEIYGGNRLKGGVTVSSYNDHRIAMSAAIAATLLCKEPVVIEGADSVNKSYPHFFDDLQMLGGKVEWLQDTEKI